MKNIFKINSLILCAFLVFSCATQGISSKKTSKSRYPTQEELLKVKDTKGLAIWYGKEMQGKRMASGEVYNMDKKTASHNSLPLGTRLLVTNISSKEDFQTEVIVTDRGPWDIAKGEANENVILGLSYRAAQELGMVFQDETKITFEVLGIDKNYESYVSYSAREGKKFIIQIATYKEKEEALKLKKILKKNYMAVYVDRVKLKGQTLYRVRFGKYSDHSLAEETAQRLKNEGYLPVLMRD